MKLNLLATTSAVLMLGVFGARAADMPVYYEEPVEQEFGGWYLRGDVGASHQRSDDIDSPVFDDIAAAGGTVTLQESEWEASWFAGVGFGYKFNDWFRADVTGEYRGKSDFFGQDFYTGSPTPPATGTNTYTGEKSEWVFLANGYVDLPSWGIVTPFVGAGVGAARVEISDFQDFNPVAGATGFSGDTSTWNFAWALHAGAAFEIDRNWTFEIAYRYLNMGDASTEDLVDAAGGSAVVNPFEFDNIHSHDIKVGMRYQFN